MNVFLYRSLSGKPVVEKIIENLSKEERSKFADVLQGIQDFGLSYDRAEFRHLHGKLWEIKFRSSDNAWRIAYVMVSADTMYWLHVFKKTSQKTKTPDLKLALKRMKEVFS